MALFTNEVLIDGQPITVDGSAVTQPVSIALPVAVTGTFYQATQPISGSVSVSNFPATQPISGSVSVSNFPATQPVSIAASVAVTGTFFQTTQPVSIADPVTVTGTVATTPGGVGLATVSRVAVNNTAAVTLSTSNASKSKVVIYNEGGTLNVKLGSTASTTDYSYVMTANSTLEIDGYYGIITARKSAGSTFAQVTEIGI